MGSFYKVLNGLDKTKLFVGYHMANTILLFLVISNFAYNFYIFVTIFYLFHIYLLKSAYSLCFDAHV